MAATTLHESAEYNARFPADRWGEVTVVLKDGRRLDSGPRNARGGPENPISEDEIIAKYRDYAGTALGSNPTPRPSRMRSAGWRSRRRPSRR